VHLLFLTGSRGEWGYIRPLLRLCQKQGYDYKICATNMHVLPAFGLSVNEIRADGFEVSDEIFMSLEGHNHYTLSKSLGIFLTSFSDLLRRVKPDWLILAGDRGEQLMGSIAAAYTYTPVAHIQAGELSGNIDGIARHALGKFAHLHFAANEDAAERLRRLGEEPFRIHNVGAPQLDELIDGAYSSGADLEKRYGIDLSRPYLLVVQHSVTEEYAAAPMQIQATLQAVNAFDMMKIWVMPNNDPGCDYVRDALIRGRKGESHIFDNLKRQDYLGFLKGAAAIVGNSSSGLLEGPSFGVPCVNIGRRQANRVRGANVIDCGHDAVEIRASIDRACGAEFRTKLRDMKNPYGDGHSSSRILEVLKATRVDSRLLTKQLTY
jgi:GDP/UDP-N,N'-diacetylbacillosamine 2-epimerase (hydrolysing)